MARSAEQDRRLYAHALDVSIIAGVITIILSVVLSTNDIAIPELIYVGTAVAIIGFGVGTYFLKRRKDAP
jgi:hypothetical protein